MTMYLIIYGLCSAAGWGASDFAGGLASRRAASHLVTLAVNACALLLLIPAALCLQEPGLPLGGWGWCMVAGALDSLALVILYAALANGQLIAAPVTALTASALPVVVGILTEGVPKPEILAGLFLALIAVWFLSHGDAGGAGCRVRFAELRLPLLSGVLIGLFLIGMHKGAGELVIWPMVAMRLGGVLILLPFSLIKGGSPRLEAFPWVLIAFIFVLDTCGTAFYILAGQSGRMDMAAVLSSLYPGMTVFLSWLLLSEKVTRTHLAGVVAALVATVLMTM